MTPQTSNAAPSVISMFVEGGGVCQDGLSADAESLYPPESRWTLRYGEMTSVRKARLTRLRYTLEHGIDVLFSSGWASAQRSKRDRIAQRIDGRNTVLPFGPGRSAQQVGGARLRDERATLPCRSRFAAEAEGAGGQQRSPDHIAELWTVSVPADHRPPPIFDEQRV